LAASALTVESPSHLVLKSSAWSWTSPTVPVEPSARWNVPVSVMALPLSVAVEGVDATEIDTMLKSESE